MEPKKSYKHLELDQITTVATQQDSQPSKCIKKIKISHPVDLAAEGNLDELTRTIDLSQIDHKHQFGCTLLHHAAKENRLKIIEYLVSSGCDIDAVDDDEQTPLHKSAMLGHTKSVKLLIEKGANVNQIDNNGNTPLHVAIISGGDFNVVEALIEKADLQIQNHNDQNVLHVAVRYHKTDNINLILNHEQASLLIATSDKDGLTPVHLAVKLGSLHITKKILKQPQVNTFRETKQGKNIIHLAAATKNAGLLSFLLDSYNTLHLINETDKKLHTPLHDAAEKGQLRQVQTLLDRGAMIKSTVDGFSPLHYACLQGHFNVVKKLTERHPFQNDLLTHNKDTPLHLAARNGHATIVQFLLDSGVQLTHNNEQASFLDIAIFNRDYEVASVVVKHKRWQECLDLISPIHPPPMIHLVQKIPEVAQIVMDHSITSAQLHSTHPCYWKQYDFKYITDAQKDTVNDPNRPCQGLFWMILYYLRFLFSLDNTNNAKPLKVIRTMMTYKRNKLFTHPLLLTFLNLKWIKYGRLYIQIRAATLLILTLLLTLLIGISDPPRAKINMSEQNNTMTNNDGNISRSLLIIILFTDTFYSLIIIMQVVFFIRLRNIFHPVHFIAEVGTIIFTAIFLLTEPTNWLAGVGALMCSWVALSIFSRYFDVFGLYTIMFYELLFKILKVLLVGLYYIIGFGLILYILIGEEFLYNSPYKAIFAVFSASISRLSVDIVANNDHQNRLQYPPVVTYGVALLVNVVLAITLINLLIGIAVRKTGTIQERALLYQAELKTRLFLQIDPIIPNLLQHKIFPKHYKIKGSGFADNKMGGIWNRFTALFAYNDEPQQNEEAVFNEKDHEIQEIAYRICQMENQIESILKILTVNAKQ